MAEDNDISARSIGPCPWCGPGTTLSLRGDGFGGQAVWCTRCACKGPTMRIEGDFDEADRVCIERWTRLSLTRPPADPETLGRIQNQIDLSVWLSGGDMRPDQNIALPFADLCRLLGVSPGDPPNSWAAGAA